MDNKPLISIFHTAERMPAGERKDIFVKLDLDIRQYLHYFNLGNHGDPWMIFTAISTYIDENGWSYPGQDLLLANTGFKRRETITRCVGFLTQLRLPTDSGPRRVLDYYHGRLANGHTRSYYHIFPEAGGADLQPDPHISKRLILIARAFPASQRGKRLGQRGLDMPEGPSTEGPLLLRPPCTVQPYMAGSPADAPCTVEPCMAMYGSDVHGATVHELEPGVFNQTLNTRAEEARATEAKIPMSLTPLHLSVPQGTNKTKQDTQTFRCTHCTATIGQGDRVCPGCQTPIIWTGNHKLEREDARAQAHAPLTNPTAQTVSSMAAWVLDFAKQHPTRIRGESIFLVTKRGATNESTLFADYAKEYGEETVKATVRKVLANGKRGRSLIVVSLAYLRAYGEDTRKPGRHAKGGRASDSERMAGEAARSPIRRR